MSTDNDSALKLCLQSWSFRGLKLNHLNNGEQIHLTENLLYRMALSNGLQESDPKDLEHLAMCPICLNQWARFRKSLSDIEDSDAYEEQRTVSWGMLEAASSSKSIEPLRIKSSCGQFFLGLLPQVGDTEKGMITLELESQAALGLEGHKATVRDHKGRIILQGAICQGRIARKIENLSEVNLTRWTVTVD